MVVLKLVSESRSRESSGQGVAGSDVLIRVELEQGIEVAW